MRASKKAISTIVLVSLLTSACATGQQGVGQALGAIAAGTICLALIDRNHQGACIAAAAAGFAVGGLIGRKLDERDRERRNAALAATLDDGRLWTNVRGSGPLNASQVNARPAPTQQPLRPGVLGTRNSWVNPDTKNAGSFEAISAYNDSRRGERECRQYRETYWKQGEPTVEVRVACRDANGHWA